MKRNTLGAFIISKRKEKKFSARQLAIKCNISAPYMCDIENGKRTPTFEVLQRISSVLEMTDENTYKLLDLAAKNSKNRVPYDIVEYIMKNASLRKCIREKMKNNDYSGWEKALEDNEQEEVK